MHIDKKISEYEGERIPGSKRTTVNKVFLFKYISIHFLFTKKSYHTINLCLTFSTYDFAKKSLQFFISKSLMIFINTAAAAAAAKSLQSCLTLCDPIDGSPRGSPVPGILQARTLEWVAIAFSGY